jgi:hypothetical protein
VSRARLCGRRELLRPWSALDRTDFNSLGQPPKSLGDDLLRIVLPYPFLHWRRKWQRLARFKTEGTNEAEGRLRHVGGLYLERGVAHARIEPGEAHGAVIDSKVHERSLVEGHAQRDVPRRLGKDQEIPQFLWQRQAAQTIWTLEAMRRPPPPMRQRLRNRVAPFAWDRQRYGSLRK